MAVSAGSAPLPMNGGMNGGITPSPVEDEELYTTLLRLQDAVLAGRHPVFKLPHPAIEQLKATLIADANGSASRANNQQQPLTSPVSSSHGLPGLKGLVGAKPALGLNPIFLEEADSVKRAKGELKRKRIEGDLRAQLDQRKHASRAGDPGIDGPSRVDVDGVLRAALIQVTPLSCLQPRSAASVSSFDENDYYSSQAPDDWSSDASSSKASDQATGAFTADYEHLDGASATQPSHPFAASSTSTQSRVTALPRSAALPSSSKARPQFYTHEPDDEYEVDEGEDDEYTPPDAAAFDSSRGELAAMDGQQTMPPEDDDSEYEPGELTQDDAMPTPDQPPTQAVQPSPRIPVFRNHLTDIAAPQPNRVSPLATAKGPSIELELVNGRPEVVQKPQTMEHTYQVNSRASTASPSAYGAGGSGKKARRSKKRKQRDYDRPEKPAKKGRRDRHVAAELPGHGEPYIKDEPVSPPAAFANVPDYEQPQYKTAPVPVDLASPGHPPPQILYTPDTSSSQLRYEYAQPAPPAAVPGASPAVYRPVQRDTQDLRRIASLHYAQRPPSPSQRYSPVAPYRSVSMTHGEQRPVPEPLEAPRYQHVTADVPVQYVRAGRTPSPPRVQYYDENLARVQSPAVMGAPPARRIVIDQYGNRYYAAEPAPTPARASVAPVERGAVPLPSREGSTNMSAAYAQPSVRYERAESRMVPPSIPAKRPQPIQYVDANGYPVRPAVRYPDEPTSPVYQPAPQYEMMPPPPPRERLSPVYQQARRYEAMAPPLAPTPPTRDAASPVYQPVPRAYSVRPEDGTQPAPSYIRQASVAPVQYVRQETMAPPPAFTRAASVMPGARADYGASPLQQQPQPQPPQQQYRYAPAPPAAVKYFDQYGREIHPQPVRQAYQ